MNELPLVSQWLQSLLTADGQLQALVGERIYVWRAPVGSTYPVVVYQPMNALDTVNEAVRVLTRTLYMVKAIAAGSYATAKSIADRIDAILTQQHGAVTGAYVPGCYRERPLDLPPDMVGDTPYYSLGGLYRIDIHAL